MPPPLILVLLIYGTETEANGVVVALLCMVAGLTVASVASILTSNIIK